ncbi:carboxypeptidase-like regulatory domain-containing protein [Neptunitalea lumnitzerae]|uniref:Carboxypeptidase regulatory-like domain-containing protein n=1 Tax=Neptunitalea lumnitzerae TaxID=2965509 RepID=A0ABQ5MM71_9FLAO|nr:carboxypeptidase-like regulatory domain-containing protein [Neptunitalea sp. Y10]GLB50180.1 hypothetical protein Y10_25480 [Neptunitalea sp. Y10]
MRSKNYLVGLLLFAFTFLSCEFELENNKRIYFTGTVVDGQGNPVPNVAVEYKERDYVLGYGVTDAAGDYAFYGMNGSDADFTLQVNDMNAFYNADYVESVMDIENRDTSNDAHIQQDFTIRKRVFLRVDVVKTSSTTDTIHWRLEYPQPICFTEFDDTILVTANCYNVVFSEFIALSQEFPDAFQRVETVLGETAVLIYEFEDGVEHQIQITLDQENINYEFEY